VELLARQVGEFACPGSRWPGAAAAAELRDALRALGTAAEVLGGPDAVTDLVAGTPADVVLNGITGSRGCGRHWPRWPPVPPWRWPTRSPWSPGGRW